MWIGLLQLIGRAVRQEFAELLESGLAFEERWELVLAGRGGDPLKNLGDVPRLDLRSPDRAAELGLERRLELAPDHDDPRVPLEVVGHAGAPSVMELIGEVERQMQVVITQRILGW
jgi:hypothetical protein